MLIEVLGQLAALFAVCCVLWLCFRWQVRRDHRPIRMQTHHVAPRLWGKPALMLSPEDHHRLHRSHVTLLGQQARTTKPYDWKEEA